MGGSTGIYVFAVMDTYSMKESTAFNIVLGDLNSDGLLDVVVINAGPYAGGGTLTQFMTKRKPSMVAQTQIAQSMNEVLGAHADAVLHTTTTCGVTVKYSTTNQILRYHTGLYGPSAFSDVADQTASSQQVATAHLVLNGVTPGVAFADLNNDGHVCSTHLVSAGRCESCGLCPLAFAKISHRA